METPTTTSNANPQTPQQQAQQQSSRNLKNWFDEFKAKVSKRNQAALVADSQCDDTTSIKSSKEHQANHHAAPSTQTTTATSPITPKIPKSSSLRARKLTKLSTTDSPDFDTASIRTIFDRRDSRYDAIAARKRLKTTSILSRLSSILLWIISYLIPFNYNLPWKLLCIVNSSFVIIVIGLINGSSQASNSLTFINGFASGLFVAIVCFVILTLSFMVQMIPKSQSVKPTVFATELDNQQSSPTRVKNNSSLRGASTVSFRDGDRTGTNNTTLEDKSEEFSLFEILDEDNQPILVEKAIEASNLDGISSTLDDDDYKGWMIEFIGDYEQRNTADIKLKSIYVKIESRILYLCKPKNSHDTDSTALPTFAQQRTFDLNNVQKFSASLLIPKSVRNKQKYVWSKKYPIRLEFQEDSVSEQVSSTSSNKSVGDESKVTQLTLFAKSCREKEEWFRRFKRIVEENRLSQGPTINKRSSIKSEESLSAENESFFGSLKRFRRRSPSPRAREGVQTSISSHHLNEAKPTVDDSSKPKSDTDNRSMNLTRTKSCELIHNEQTSDKSDPNNELDHRATDDDAPHLDSELANDSTLTKETAELFSQAVGFSNFLDSQPSLNYQEYIEGIISSGREAGPTSDWFNALTGRIFYDVFSHDYWSVWFKRKIQRKLYKIRLPYFMETLTLTNIDLGTNAPHFLNVVSHHYDSYGLSIDFDMAYSGGLSMTFETKLNLLKIKSDNQASGNSSCNNSNSVNSSTQAPVGSLTTSTNPAQSASTIGQSSSGSSQQHCESLIRDSGPATESSSENVSREGLGRPPTLSSSNSTRTSVESTDSDDSDSSSSSDSSFDEGDANEISDWEDYGAEKTRQNIVKFVDRIASSRYFQHATENRFIKRKLQDISNCPLVLVVQIQSLNGILTVNVPPPQTDRIWYGFKPQPELTLKALPKMGDREVSLSHVTDWIERKLAEEFRKILVIPNMEDIVLPVLKSDHLQYITATK